MEVLSKDMIECWIVPHLNVGKRGTKMKVEMWRVVSAILYRLKSGCHWEMLPVEKFFTSGNRLMAGCDYQHFSKWVRNGCFQRDWAALVKANHPSLDLSSVQLDGTHTGKNGGEHIGYQNRKKAKTTNALFLSDNQGLPLAVATPQGATTMTSTIFSHSLTSCARCCSRQV